MLFRRKEGMLSDMEVIAHGNQKCDLRAAHGKGHVASLSCEPDGAINEDYCKWCYADGKFAYTSMDKLIDFCAEHMASEQWPAGQVRAYLAGLLPTLKHWQAAE